MGQKNKKTDPPKNPPDDDDDEDGDDEEVPVSRKDLMKMVNGAVTGILNRKLGPAIEAANAPLMKKLEEIGGGKKNDEDDDDVDDDDDDADDPPAPPKGKRDRDRDRPRRDPVVAKLNKRLEDMDRQLKERDEKLAKEEAARKATLIDNELTQALSEIGVDKHRVRGALAVHRALAAVDDDGQVTYKVKRDGYDEDLAPIDALKEWAATDEGKSYLAPTGSPGGSGARAPKPAPPRGKPAPNSPEAKHQRVQEAKTSLLGAVSELTAGGSVVIE